MEMSSNPLLINSTVHKCKLSYSFPTDNASQSRRCYLPENFCIKVLWFVLLQTTSIQPPSPLAQRTPDLFSFVQITGFEMNILNLPLCKCRPQHSHNLSQSNAAICSVRLKGERGHTDFHTNTTQIYSELLYTNVFLLVKNTLWVFWIFNLN